MTRCPHTGLSKPECSCPACLRELVRNHAPRPPAPTTAATTGATDDDDRAAAQR